jgi:phthalate 4,5-dioxygenase oxygenase subunit
LIDCNWLQALEVGIDPAHASYLHRFFEDEDTVGQLRQAVPRRLGRLRHADHARAARVRPPGDQRREDRLRPAPDRAAQLSEADTHVRVTNLMFPQAFVIPMSAEMTISQWHVPVDDDALLLVRDLHQLRRPGGQGADARAAPRSSTSCRTTCSRKNRANDYGYDPHEQRDQTYTGMGFDINVHDQWAVESQGAHPGPHARASRHHRQGRSSPTAACCEAIEKNQSGARPLMVLDAAAADALSGPPSIDGIGPTGAGTTTGRIRPQAQAAVALGGGAPDRGAGMSAAHALRRAPRPVESAGPGRAAAAQLVAGTAADARHRGGALLVSRPARHPARQDAGGRGAMPGPSNEGLH